MACISHQSFRIRFRAAEGRHHAAAGHHHHAIAQAENLREVGGDEDERHSPGRQLADQAVDRRLGANVDAAGRLVENENPSGQDQSAAEHAFLLVAAAEAPDRLIERPQPDPQALDQIEDRLIGSRGLKLAVGGEPAESG
jgi:hypothetical protein